MTDTKKYDIAFFNVITPLHNGAGEGLGIIDNPILRERKTQFPLIQASTLKGVFRAEYEITDPSNSSILFGPSVGEGQEHAGAISFGDGMVLAFPVRSIKGCFAWITSPLVIWRFYDRVRLMKMESEFPKLCELANIIHSMKKFNRCSGGEEKLCINNTIFLEEFPFTCDESSELTDFANEIGEYIFNKETSDFLKEEFKSKLLLLDDDTFTYFVTNATEVVPNIKIGSSGTTEKTSLRYTEYLPSETIIYCTLIFERSKKVTLPSGVLTAPGIKDLFKNKFSSSCIIQAGGDETTGKGVLKISLASSVKN